jgi:hypothetical protein
MWKIIDFGLVMVFGLGATDGERSLCSSTGDRQMQKDERDLRDQREEEDRTLVLNRISRL